MSLVIFRGICRFISAYLMAWVATTAIGHLRQDMFDKMLLLPSEQYQSMSSGEMLMNMVQMVENSINHASGIFYCFNTRYLDCHWAGLCTVLFKLATCLTDHGHVSNFIGVITLLP